MDAIYELKKNLTQVTSSPSSPKLKPVAFVEINPDLPELSPSNMLRLGALVASQRTLSLFTPSIPDVIYRSNLEILEREKRVQEQDFKKMNGGDDLSEIMKGQAMYNTRNRQPKRRVIKVNLSKKEKVVQTENPKCGKGQY